MLINQESTEVVSHVEFVEYTGKYPVLCEGDLTLKIDGKRYKFGNKQKHPIFWIPSGCSMGMGTDEWAIDVSELPEEIRKYAAEIDNVFNVNVEYGHCGGCK